MHEMGLTQEIVERVAVRAGEARVRKVVVEVGALACVLPDAMRFCFELCVEDTALAGAALEIVGVPGRARCRACAGEVALTRPFGRCACGSSDLDWLSGEDVTIQAVEVSD